MRIEVRTTDLVGDFQSFNVKLHVLSLGQVVADSRLTESVEQLVYQISICSKVRTSSSDIAGIDFFFSGIFCPIGESKLLYGKFSSTIIS